MRTLRRPAPEGRVGVVSSEFANAVLRRVRAIAPRLRLRFEGEPAMQRAAGGAQRRGNLAAVLIDIADMVEAGCVATLRQLRRALRGVTGGLLWRGLAAATGIGMTAALVTGLSSASQEPDLPRLSALSAIEPVNAAPAVRDVRVQAVPVALGAEGWVSVARPIALFGLQSPELDRRTLYEARRSSDGSRREDLLGFGEFGDARPFLALKLLVNRDGEAERADATPSQPFVVGLVRDSAARGLSVARSGTMTSIDTKFGAVETADVGLSDGALGRSCIAFRHQDGAAHLSFSGWWCGGEGRPADRAQLVCLLDRVDLLAAGDDHEMRAIFSRIELNRKAGCAPSRLQAAGRKASWLDPDAKPPVLKSGAARQAAAAR